MNMVAAQRPGPLVRACVTCGLPHVPGTACPVVGHLPVLAAHSTLTPGLVVGGRFRIVGIAHRSSMSTVYRAVDERTRFQPVAVKEFSGAGLPDDERAEALKWLAREAGLLSSLHEQHLATLIAAFSEGDRHYLVMPYLAGETLKELYERVGPLPEIDVVHWAKSLADILIYLHGQDPPVIHRDLKPANILLRPDGQLMLLDLGVARPLPRGEVGTAIGTPGYAPPEQYQGFADARSDLYALGATMHFLLTGYDAERAVPFRHPSVRELNPRSSRAMERLINRLLNVAPEQRPTDAISVRNQLINLDVYGTTVVSALYSNMMQLLAAGTLSVAGLQLVSIQALNGDLIGILSPIPAMLGLLPAFVPAVRQAARHERSIARARRNGINAVWIPYVGYIFAQAILEGSGQWIGLAFALLSLVWMSLFWYRAETRIRRAGSEDQDADAGAPLQLQP
jgi:serine/threonine protein kinase